MPKEMTTTTADAFFRGRIRVDQDRHGYRFSIDAVLLAAFCRLPSCRTIVDLGTGCGIIALILGYRYPRARIQAVEIQPALAEFARENARRNAMEERIAILQMDLRALTPRMVSGPVDAVVSNPPYHRERSGRVNPDEQRALARHEIALTLPELVQTARRLLKTGGRFLTIYPAERLAELLSRMGAERIEPKRVRAVHSGRSQAAKLILVEGIKGARPGVAVEAPLFLYKAGGGYTPELRKMLAP
jgi:tRNA1Val (adenine37-N6)-methyltransferase